jgi:hypothetical protein
MATVAKMSTRDPRGVYSGPERRRHRVYLTRNSEYHCRDDLCVAVRDVASGDFLEGHPAIGRRMTGSIRFTEDGGIASFSTKDEEPHPGESLFFSDGAMERELRTSALRDIQRPPKAVVARYRI